MKTDRDIFEAWYATQPLPDLLARMDAKQAAFNAWLAGRAHLAQPEHQEGIKLKRGTTGKCGKSLCTCERDGLGDECVWLEPATPHPEQDKPAVISTKSAVWDESYIVKAYRLADELRNHLAVAPPAAPAQTAVDAQKEIAQLKAMVRHLSEHITAISPAAPAMAVEPTKEMAEAYLAANNAYWKEVDAMPQEQRNPSKYRNGTPLEATMVSLRAALGRIIPAEPRKRMTAVEIDKHIGPDEGDREAVTAVVREVEAFHGITEGSDK